MSISLILATANEVNNRGNANKIKSALLELKDSDIIDADIDGIALNTFFTVRIKDIENDRMEEFPSIEASAMNGFTAMFMDDYFDIMDIELPVDLKKSTLLAVYTTAISRANIDGKSRNHSSCISTESIQHMEQTLGISDRTIHKYMDCLSVHRILFKVTFDSVSSRGFAKRNIYARWNNRDKAILALFNCRESLFVKEVKGLDKIGIRLLTLEESEDILSRLILATEITCKWVDDNVLDVLEGDLLI